MSRTHRLAVVADAAATDLATTTGVSSVRGVVVRDDGRLVLHLTATVDADAQLGVVVGHVDQVAALVRHADRRPRLQCRFTLTCAGPAAPAR